MPKRNRAQGVERVFAVVGELADDAEVDLYGVLTWASEERLRQQLLSGLPMVSHRVVIGDMHGPTRVGMRLPVGSDERWLVRCGPDRGVGPLAAGTVLTFLDSAYVGSGNARLWEVWPRPSGQGTVRRTAIGLTVEMAS
jgi:hypothetical protein